MANEGHHILDVGQAGFARWRQRRGRLLVRHGIRAFRRVESWSVHRPGADCGHRDAAWAQLFGRCAGVVLDRSLGASIGGVKWRERAQQRSDQCTDLAVVVQVHARFLEEEEGGLRIDSRHLVVFGLADLGHGFLEHLADGVDGDVRLAYSADGVGKQLLNGTRGREISLQRYGLRAAGLNGRDGGIGIGIGIGIGLGGSAVVMNGDGLGALRGQVASDQAAKIRGAAGDLFCLASSFGLSVRAQSERESHDDCSCQ